MTENLIFSYSRSTERFTTKPTDEQTANIVLQEKQGTIKDLITDIRSGYAFANTFKNTGGKFIMKKKTRPNFKQAHFLTFDFDDVRTPAGVFFGTMTCTEIPPTLVYTTSSNGMDNGKEYNNRYRVIYLLDQPITTAENYTTIHQALKDEICSTIDDDTIYNDNTDQQPERLFYGNASTDIDVFTHPQKYVTPLKMILDRYGIVNDNDTDTQSVNDTEICGDILYNTSDWASAYTFNDSTEMGTNYNDVGKCQVDIYSMQCTLSGGNIQRLGTFLADFKNTRLNFSQLYKKYNGILTNLPEHTAVNTDTDKLIIEHDEDYYKIMHRGQWVEKINKRGDRVKMWQPYKFKNGERRRNKVYNYLMNLRRITPTATAVELLWAATCFCHQRTDYNDLQQTIKSKRDVIKKYEVLGIVHNALNKDINEYIQQQEQNRQRRIKQGKKVIKQPKYEVNRAAAAEQGITPRMAALKENVKRLQDQRRKTSEAIAQYYNADWSIKENLTYLQDMGVKVSRRTLTRWMAENGYSKPRKKTNENENKCAVSVSISPNGQVCKAANKTQQGAFNDVVALAENFLQGGTKSKTEKDDFMKNDVNKKLDFIDFYKSHHTKGAKYVHLTDKDDTDILRSMGWEVDDETDQETETDNSLQPIEELSF